MTKLTYETQSQELRSELFADHPNKEGLGMGPTLREFFTILVNPIYWIRTIAGGVQTLREERRASKQPSESK